MRISTVNSHGEVLTKYAQSDIILCKMGEKTFAYCVNRQMEKQIFELGGKNVGIYVGMPVHLINEEFDKVFLKIKNLEEYREENIFNERAIKRLREIKGTKEDEKILKKIRWTKQDREDYKNCQAK